MEETGAQAALRMEVTCTMYHDWKLLQACPVQIDFQTKHLGGQNVQTRQNLYTVQNKCNHWWVETVNEETVTTLPTLPTLPLYV